MIVGPTVLMVSIGTGAPARIDSSKKMNCSIAVAPLPPYSFGQPMPDPAVGAHLLPDAARRLADAVRCRELGDGLLVEQLLVVARAAPIRIASCSGVYPISMRTPVF